MTAGLLTFLLLLVPSCSRKQKAGTQESPSAAPYLTIASFNLRVFGVTKASHPAVMNVLADAIARYDIVAVQEIRDKSGSAIQELLGLVDSKNSGYRIIIGERLGRSRSKEQYAFFYDSSRVRVDGCPYTYDDDNDGDSVNRADDTGLNDLFEREPFLAHFKSAQGTFDFVIGDIHVKPADAAEEIAYLPSVIADASSHYAEADVLLVGDFNADGSYFDENTYASDFPAQSFIWIISNSVDTTVASSDNTYDRMVGTASMAEDYEGESGTFRFDQEFDLRSLGLSSTDISDHYPVWAKFYSSKDTD